MASSIAQRIFLAHLELSYRLGRRVSLAEFGEMIATQMGRDAAFTAAAVSRWEKGVQLPGPHVIEAIAGLTGVDPGWLSHGEKTAAPAPRLRHPSPQPSPSGLAPAPATPATERERQAERQAEQPGRERRTP